MKLIEFNLNDYVHFQVNERTQKYLDGYNLRLFGDPKVWFAVKVEPDENGWCRWQGHKFMNVFGEEMVNGIYPPVGVTIKFEVEDVE